MKVGKVSAFKSWTSEAEARAAAPKSPKAAFLKFRMVAVKRRDPKTIRVSVIGGEIGEECETREVNHDSMLSTVTTWGNEWK